MYGIQKVPETEVRSNGDLAMGTASGAAIGAQAGSSFGVAGTIAGGFIGGAAGLFGGMAGQDEEKKMLTKQQDRNDFVDSLSGRGQRADVEVARQAENGMNANKSMVAEIEGDGGRYKGIGEIHVDKNFNIKTVAAGAPKHEEGGYMISMEEGDAVFPTQNNEKDFRSALNDLKRYNVYGDKRALKRLEKRRDSLPTNEDYGYAENGLRYNEGVNLDGRTNTPYSSEVQQAMADEQNPEVPYRRGSEMEDEYEEKSANGWDYKLNKTTGELQVKKKGAKNWKTREKAWGVNNTNKPGTATNEQETIEAVFPGYKKPVGLPDQKDRYDIPSTLTETGGVTDVKAPVNQEQVETPAEAVKKETAAKKNNTPTKKEQTSGSGQGSQMSNDMNRLMKYSSVMNNLARGAEPAEQTLRRQMSFNPQEYEDQSAGARAGAIENRNFMTKAVNSVGRNINLGVNEQIGNQYYRANEAINQKERLLRYENDRYNNQQGNQVNQANVTMAREDDDKDAMNRAATRKYQDTAAVEMAELGQYGEQMDYAKNLDSLKMAQDERSMRYLGTRKYNFDQNQNLQYRGKPQSNEEFYQLDPNSGNVEETATGEKGLVYKGKKKNKKTTLKPGTYSILPDGTIIS
jgi:hypothetical protein